MSRALQSDMQTAQGVTHWANPTLLNLCFKQGFWDVLTSPASCILASGIGWVMPPCAESSCPTEGLGFQGP